MKSVFFAPFTKLFELNFALNFFLIFPAEIVRAFAGLTHEFYKLVLGHIFVVREYPKHPQKARTRHAQARGG